MFIAPEESKQNGDWIVSSPPAVAAYEQQSKNNQTFNYGSLCYGQTRIDSYQDT